MSRLISTIVTNTPSRADDGMDSDSPSEGPLMLPELVPLIFAHLGPQSKRSLLEAMLCSRQFYFLGLPLLYADICLPGPWSKIAELAENIMQNCMAGAVDKFPYVKTLRLGGEGWTGPGRHSSAYLTRVGRVFSVEDTVDTLSHFLRLCCNLGSIAFAPASDCPPLSEVVFEAVKKLNVPRVDLLLRHRGLTFGPYGKQYSLPDLEHITFHRNEWRLTFEALLAGSLDGLPLLRTAPSLKSWSLVSDAAPFDDPAWHSETWFVRLWRDEARGQRSDEPPRATFFYKFHSERNLEDDSVNVTVTMTSRMLSHNTHALSIFPEIIRTIKALPSPAKLDTIELVDLTTQLVLNLDALPRFSLLRYIRPRFGLVGAERREQAAQIVAAKVGLVELEAVSRDVLDPGSAEELRFWEDLGANLIG